MAVLSGEGGRAGPLSQHGAPSLAPSSPMSPLSPQCLPARTLSSSQGLEERCGGDGSLLGEGTKRAGGSGKDRSCGWEEAGLPLQGAGPSVLSCREPQDTWPGASPMRSSKTGLASTQPCPRFPEPGLTRAKIGGWAVEAPHPAWSMAEQAQGPGLKHQHSRGVPGLGRQQLPLPHTHPCLLWSLAELPERVGLFPGPPNV